MCLTGNVEFWLFSITISRRDSSSHREPWNSTNQEAKTTAVGWNAGRSRRYEAFLTRWTLYTCLLYVSKDCLFLFGNGFYSVYQFKVVSVITALSEYTKVGGWIVISLFSMHMPIMGGFMQYLFGNWKLRWCILAFNWLTWHT